MSKERIPRDSSFDQAETQRTSTERRVERLFRRAGWKDLNTREARRGAIRDEFENLFIEALFDENSSYQIRETYSKKTKSFEIAIIKEAKTVAVKTTFDNQEAGQPNTIYNVVKETRSWRRDLVFQLVEFTPFKTHQPSPALHIGYYRGEGRATHIISDEMK